MRRRNKRKKWGNRKKEEGKEKVSGSGRKWES